jgi:hypothetical protein
MDSMRPKKSLFAELLRILLLPAIQSEQLCDGGEFR